MDPSKLVKSDFCENTLSVSESHCTNVPVHRVYHYMVPKPTGAWRGEENWQVKGRVFSQQDPPGWNKNGTSSPAFRLGFEIKK